MHSPEAVIKQRTTPEGEHPKRHLDRDVAGTFESESRQIASEPYIAIAIVAIPLALVPLCIGQQYPSVVACRLSGDCTTSVGTSTRVTCSCTGDTVTWVAVVLGSWSTADSGTSNDSGLTVICSCTIGCTELLARGCCILATVSDSYCTIASRCTRCQEDRACMCVVVAI